MTDERDVTSSASHPQNAAGNVEPGERSGPPVRSAHPAPGTGARDTKPPRDLRQELTDRMVAALGQGTIPWERPWHEVRAGRPRNLLSARDYRGGNRLMLMMVQLEKGYTDPHFATIRQINQLGGSVKKGEKGYPIEYWGEQPFYERRDVELSYLGDRVNVLTEARQGVVIRGTNAAAPPRRVSAEDLAVWHQDQKLTWQQAHERLDRMVGRVSTVFNVAQTAGLTLDAIDPAPQAPIPSIERAERLLKSMRSDGLQFETDNRGAYYLPPRDTVYLPDRERFTSSEGYYGTALHEIGHATGAAKRLNREGITGNHRYGTAAYAREELRAELFSVFMAAETGIPHDENQHRAYIQSWAQILKSDKHEIFRAASEAGKAVDYVLGREQERAQTVEQTAERQPEPEHNDRVADLSVTDPPPAHGESNPPHTRHTASTRGRALER
jgi:antirestriction protein ArdC